MISGSQVYQVARAVANGDGDWAEVPRCVREAIVLSLGRPTSRPEGLVDAADSSESWLKKDRPLVDIPPVLSEGVVQRSIQTFEDAAWMRDQAVRSYAQFHNNIETLYTAMRGQLRALWKTAMQLHPEILHSVRREYRLRETDEIPDGVPLAQSAVQHIIEQERVLDDLVTNLDAVRESSVRFAAYFLTDEEKMAMGANPAFLRPDDIEREVEARSRSRRYDSRAESYVASNSPSRTRRERTTAVSSVVVPTPTARERSRSATPKQSPRKSRRTIEVLISPRRLPSPGAKEDACLAELRRQYMMRIAELNERAEEERSPGASHHRRQRHQGQPREHHTPHQTPNRHRRRSAHKRRTPRRRRSPSSHCSPSYHSQHSSTLSRSQ